jgi:putative transposase
LQDVDAVLSAFKYRIYPKPKQEMRLKRSLLLLCDLYNRLRAEKIEEYKQLGVSLTRNDLRLLALEERRNDTELRTIHSQVVQNVADRLYEAFENFFAGRARFPKNKVAGKFLSMTYPQSGFKIDSREGLKLSGIGHIRIFMHRPIVGKVERLTIKRDVREWYAIFLTERQVPPKQPIEEVPEARIRGADLGLDTFLALDNRESIYYPEYMRRSEHKIRALQRRLGTKVKGSRRWRQVCFSLAKVHIHTKRQREDWQNKCIAEIFTGSDILILEKLDIKGMLGNYRLAKSILDASFGKFACKSRFKAELLGKRVVTVDPWGTTQYCYVCLTWVPKDLAQRRHICPNCGVDIPRDLNSARLIKRLGIHSRPPSDGGSSPAEPRPIPSLRGIANQGVEAGSLRSKPEEDITWFPSDSLCMKNSFARSIKPTSPCDTVLK